MPIYDQTFRRYEGPRNTSGIWLVVAGQTLRPVLQSKIAKVILVGLIILVTVYSFGLFVGAKFSQVAPEHADAVAQVGRDNAIPMFGRNVGLNTIMYDFLMFQGALVWLLLLVTGGGSVSSDIRNAALPLYFSRPLRPRDYVMGKVFGLAAGPATVSCIAALLIYLQAVAYYYPVSDLWLQSGILMRAVLYAVLSSLFVSLLMVAFSSASRKAATAQVTFFGFFVLTQVVVNITRRGFRFPEIALVSPLLDNRILAVELFRPELRHARRQASIEQYDPWMAAAVRGVYAVIALLMIRRNLRVVEVVK